WPCFLKLSQAFSAGSLLANKNCRRVTVAVSLARNLKNEGLDPDGRDHVLEDVDVVEAIALWAEGVVHFLEFGERRVGHQPPGACRKFGCRTPDGRVQARAAL